MPSAQGVSQSPFGPLSGARNGVTAKLSRSPSWQAARPRIVLLAGFAGSLQYFVNVDTPWLAPS